MTTLTDNMIAQLYLGLASDYKALSNTDFNQIESYPNQPLRHNYIYQHLYNHIYRALASSDSCLSDLDAEEKKKIWTVFYTFYKATPLYRSMSEEMQATFFKQDMIPLNLPVDYRPYCHRDDVSFDWKMLSSFMDTVHFHDSSTHQAYIKAKAPPKSWLYLGLATVAVLASFGSALALFYLLSAFANSVERFVYNEGWLQGMTTIAAMLGGAVAGGLLGVYIAAIPLIILALTIGISNPIGFAMVGIVILTILTAALVSGLTNIIQNKVIEKNHKAAIDPADPYRFTLTQKEIDNLEDNNIDPLKVKTAIIALRQRIGEEPVPSLFFRCTNNGKEKQDCLKNIRMLRRGELPEVEIEEGGMLFNVMKDGLQPELEVELDNSGTSSMPMKDDLQSLRVEEFESTSSMSL